MKRGVIDESTEREGALRCAWLLAPGDGEGYSPTACKWALAFSGLLLCNTCAVGTLGEAGVLSAWLYGNDGFQFLLRGWSGRVMRKGVT